MAELHNEQRTLRLQLLVADRERTPKVLLPSALGEGRILARVGIEHYDSSDQKFWPLLRLVTYWFRMEEARELLDALERLIRGESQGFSFRSKVSDEFGLQVSCGEANRHVVEAGMDLRLFLKQTAGQSAGAGEDLALVRFTATQAELVSFASQVRTEIRELLERDGVNATI